MKPYVVIAFLLFASVANALSVPPPQAQKTQDEVVAVEGVKLHEILGVTEHPSIPKTWKLISVSPGEKSNSSNLWFQDADGAIYLLQGFMSQNKFLLHEHVYKIPAN